MNIHFLKPILSLFLLLISPFLIAQNEEFKLSKLDLTKALQSFGETKTDLSADGGMLQIGDNTYASGVGIHANSKITLRLQKKAEQFTAQIGVGKSSVDLKGKDISSVPLTDGTMIFYQEKEGQKQFVGIGNGNREMSSGSICFRLIADGKEIYNSGILKGGERAREISVALKNVDKLELVADDAGDGSSGDFGVWGDAVIVASQKPEAASSDYVGEIKSLSPEVIKSLTQKIEKLPQTQLPQSRPEKDWLIDPSSAKARIMQTHDGKSIILTNGLVSRIFRITPNLATIEWTNLMTGESLLRAVSNEGILKINGREYPLGGLSGQPEFGYTLYKWIDSMQIIPGSFRVKDFDVSPLTPRIKWAKKRWALEHKGELSGKVLTFYLEGPGEWENLTVKIHYALYDHIPVISKWIEVENRTGRNVHLDNFVLEQLAMAEPDSPVENTKNEQFRKPNIHVESDWGFLGFTEKEAERTEFWEVDTRYTSQCNYPMVTPCLLEVKLPLGPDVDIPAGDTFSTFRTWLMPFDSDDRERKGLFVKRMYRKIAPWTTENPIFMHCTSSDPKVVREAVDQCAATGYEMVILSFGSGLNMENESAENIAKFKELRQYANSKGIELGGYSLLSSRWISDDVDVINPETGKRGGMIFGSSPCLCSEWGYDYFRKIRLFFEKTGMTVFENDGSYPGNVCASEKHAHHKGLLDSQWEQRKQISTLYQWMCENGIYTNVPDYGYVLNGSTKVGIGYREVNWSLPRERQLVLGRQVIYDGLWERLPSMCWSFVPLTQYHGGGAAATLEPLKDHLNDYKAHMIQNYGSGIQACYRGHRLYDSPETQQTVTDVILWYKKYRDILNSELLHIRRPDGKDFDAVMHVNPTLKERALVMIYNPTDEEIVRSVKLPLYYTGLTQSARIREQEGKSKKYKLDRDYTTTVEVILTAKGYTWLVIEE